MSHYDCYKFVDVNNDFEIICLEIKNLHMINWYHFLILYLVNHFVDNDCSYYQH